MIHVHGGEQNKENGEGAANFSDCSPTIAQHEDSWITFFSNFAFLFTNSQILKDTISVGIFALFNTLCAYFLGDFLTKSSFVGIVITLIAVALLTTLSIIQMRRIILQALGIFKIIPFAFCFAMLSVIVIASNLISAIVLRIFSLSTIGQGLMGGSLVSMTIIIVVYLFYAYWIFLWKRIKWRKHQ